ncbi:MAG: M23 family metallopeptidase [Anaerolineae bacterium]|nr:M23 family metallopeptidase [Anaerolineae bacterium]
MQRQLNGLLSDQATERVRQREMRATILSQQDEVRNLASQVEGFKAELLSVRRLSDEIRDILGLPAPTPAASPIPTETPDGAPSESWGWRGTSEAPMGGRLAVRPSSRSMRMAVERGQELVGMRSAVPVEVQALQELRELVLERLSRIDKDDQGDWETLQRELRQWAAAPHRWPAYPHPISSEFGYREFRGAYGFHYGIDLAVWTGTKVRATKDGTVTVAGWRPGYGWTVEIAHEAGYSTLYAHNSALKVKVGSKVKAGDVIALSGSSGNSTGPHLHYEIHLYGSPVDPLRYIDEG